MTHTQPIAIGEVISLNINGAIKQQIVFELDGPAGDKHAGFVRELSGHDGEYIKTSDLKKGDEVFNCRSWTGLSFEEIDEVQRAIGYEILEGILLENIVIFGIPNFSKLEPGTRLVFPSREQDGKTQQAILIVWEENGPCVTVGQRLENFYDVKGLKTNFVREAQGKRGVMGFVYSAGPVWVGDKVLVYPPVR